MKRGKRSARFTGLLLLVGAAVLLLGMGVLVMVRGLVPAGAAAGGPSAGLLQMWEAVAVLDEPDEWVAGVRDYPLRSGEQLIFDFGREVSPRWTMAGVDYPLVLVALSEAGEPLDARQMSPCAADAAPVCETYGLDVAARFWVERRP